MPHVKASKLAYQWKATYHIGADKNVVMISGDDAVRVDVCPRPIHMPVGRIKRSRPVLP